MGFERNPGAFEVKIFALLRKSQGPTLDFELLIQETHRFQFDKQIGQYPGGKQIGSGEHCHWLITDGRDAHDFE